MFLISNGVRTIRVLLMGNTRLLSKPLIACFSLLLEIRGHHSKAYSAACPLSIRGVHHLDHDHLINARELCRASAPDVLDLAFVRLGNITLRLSCPLCRVWFSL